MSVQSTPVGVGPTPVRAPKPYMLAGSTVPPPVKEEEKYQSARHTQTRLKRSASSCAPPIGPFSGSIPGPLLEVDGFGTEPLEGRSLAASEYHIGSISS